jgi:hypothetical protein
MLDQALSAVKTIEAQPALVIFLSLSLLNLGGTGGVIAAPLFNVGHLLAVCSHGSRGPGLLMG